MKKWIRKWVGCVVVVRAAGMAERDVDVALREGRESALLQAVLSVIDGHMAEAAAEAAMGGARGRPGVLEGLSGRVEGLGLLREELVERAGKGGELP